MVVGRLAPSPTGALHLGNARTFLGAWLSARKRSGRVILRIEDLDSPRVKPWARKATVDDLAWLGLDWDEGPDVGGPNGPYVQTERLAAYREPLKSCRSASWSIHVTARAVRLPQQPARRMKRWKVPFTEAHARIAAWPTHKR